jgi:hypothetical protein
MLRPVLVLRQWAFPLGIGLLNACAAPDLAAERSNSPEEGDAPVRVGEGDPTASPALPSPAPLAPEARDAAVGQLAQLVADEYVFPDVGAQLHDMLLARLAERAYDALDTAPALAAQLTDDMAEIAHDKHLRVNARLPLGAAPPLPPPPRAGIRRLELLPDNIGYIELEGVPLLEAAGSAIAGAFAFLQQSDALIIDNRENFGGAPATVARYVSYLQEGPPVLISRLHERDDRRVVEFFTEDLGQRSYGASRPVFVLTSAATFSGGEALSYDLQAMGRATVIGEVTGGGAHPTAGYPLGNGLMAAIPFAQTISAITGSNWEGSGVQPDVAAPADQALDVARSLAHDTLYADPAYVARLGDPAGRPALSAQRTEPRPAIAENPIYNADFASGIAPWGVTSWQNPGQPAPHAYDLEDGKLCLTLLPHERVIIGWPQEATPYAFHVTRGNRHQLSLRASASGPLPIISDLTVGHRLPPYGIYAAARLPLDASFESYTMDFEPEVSDDQTGLSVQLQALGDAGESRLCFDDFLITTDAPACTAP